MDLYLYSLHVCIAGTGFAKPFFTVAAAATISSSYAHSTVSWIGLPVTVKHDTLSLRVAARTLSDMQGLEYSLGPLSIHEIW